MSVDRSESYRAPRDLTDPEIGELLTKIERIPADQLPDADAREALRSLARFGGLRDIYYHAPGDCVIELWTPPWMDARRSCEEWMAEYHAKLMLREATEGGAA